MELYSIEVFKFLLSGKSREVDACVTDITQEREFVGGYTGLPYLIYQADRVELIDSERLTEIAGAQVEIGDRCRFQLRGDTIYDITAMIFVEQENKL